MKKQVKDAWDKDIADLEAFFASITLPARPVKMDVCTTIVDVSLFVTAHLQVVKANKGNKTFLPYLDRLKQFKIKVSKLNTPITL